MPSAQREAGYDAWVEFDVRRLSGCSPCSGAGDPDLRYGCNAISCKLKCFCSGATSLSLHIKSRGFHANARSSHCGNHFNSRGRRLDEGVGPATTDPASPSAVMVIEEVQRKDMKLPLVVDLNEAY
jgi:hypothetical protein